MPPLILRIDNFDRAAALSVNRWSRRRTVAAFFSAVSRLGDGIVWYSLLALWLVASGGAAWRGVLHVGATALIAVGIYKLLKSRLHRERPFVADTTIGCVCAPLDRYSFPSGHTLHATLFATLFMAVSPALGLALTVFAALVAISRLVLGLHYPTDVIVGALLGACLAEASLALSIYTGAL